MVAHLETRIFSSIHDVPAELWDGLARRGSNTCSWAFWQLIEQAGLNDFSYKYVLFFDDAGQPVALTTIYSVTTDIAIFAPRRLRGVLGRVRRVFPNFLKLRMLECGTPITLNSPGFITDGEVPDDIVVATLDYVLRETCRQEKQLLIIVRDFEPGTEDLQSDFRKLGYAIVRGLPNTYMNILWRQPQDYVAAMKSYYRSKLQKHLRKAAEDQNLRHEMVDDFGGLAEKLCAQWLKVHENAGEFQREVLTPDFYRNFPAAMRPHAHAILFYRDEELVGHVLLLMDGEMLRWLYFGRRVPANDSLYIYAGHKVVEAAIALGARRLELGLTTYPVKQDLGAIVTPINFAIRARWRLLDPVVRLVYPLINHVPRLSQRDIFKQSADTGDAA